MPTLLFERSTPLVRTPRLTQLEGLFDLPLATVSRRQWRVDLPIDDEPWSIGCIVAPSGAGKSTLAREAFGDAVVTNFAWPHDRSIVDAFPESLGIKDITGLLSAVGFSSPPAWLRPFACLSTGEQFRVTLARALAEAQAGSRDLVVLDEYTSVVDRTVARIGSAAVAKAIRRANLKFVAVGCHYDVIDWLQPDWTCEPHTNTFVWRSVRSRPDIELCISRAPATAWRTFRNHHYLSTALHPAARCYVASVEGQPAAFTAVLPFPHPRKPGWREHRTVCLPDFQGVGIGNALSEFVASIYAATGKPYRSVTSHPAMIYHRARSPLWQMSRPPGRSGRHAMHSLRRQSSNNRLTASFRYVGPRRPTDACRLGLLVAPPTQ